MKGAKLLFGDYMKKCDEILRSILRLTETMVELADLGDEAREDVGCGVLYGLLRDSAYKIRKAAELEKDDHLRRGWRTQEEKSVNGKGTGRSPCLLQTKPNSNLRRKSK